MDPLAYLHLQMRLEGKEVVRGCLMRRVEAVPGEGMPLLLVAQLANAGVVVYYDENAPPELRKDLAANVSDLEFPQIAAMLNVLQAKNIQLEVGHYRTYIVASQPAEDPGVGRFSKHDPNVEAFGFDGFAETVYAIHHKGSLASACVSTRENRECGEAWVYTAPEHRHRGFARRVVNAWARSLMAAGKVPFYSHRIENDASASLARKLGLQPVFEEIAITQISST